MLYYTVIAFTYLGELCSVWGVFSAVKERTISEL